jgi:hypothetical protein
MRDCISAFVTFFLSSSTIFQSKPQIKRTWMTSHVLSRSSSSATRYPKISRHNIHVWCERCRNLYLRPSSSHLFSIYLSENEAATQSCLSVQFQDSVHLSKAPSQLFMRGGLERSKTTLRQIHILAQYTWHLCCWTKTGATNLRCLEIHHGAVYAERKGSGGTATTSGRRRHGTVLFKRHGDHSYVSVRLSVFPHPFY